MTDVSIRDLRNKGGEVIARVQAGEEIIVTKSGRPVAELRPLQRRGVDPHTLLNAWSKLPLVDPERLRGDIDDLLDSSV
jgi:prevent-host-death family protein